MDPLKSNGAGHRVSKVHPGMSRKEWLKTKEGKKYKAEYHKQWSKKRPLTVKEYHRKSRQNHPDAEKERRRRKYPCYQLWLVIRDHQPVINEMA